MRELTQQQAVDLLVKYTKVSQENAERWVDLAYSHCISGVASGSDTMCEVAHLGDKLLLCLLRDNKIHFETQE